MEFRLKNKKVSFQTQSTACQQCIEVQVNLFLQEYIRNKPVLNLIMDQIRNRENKRFRYDSALFHQQFISLVRNSIRGIDLRPLDSRFRKLTCKIYMKQNIRDCS